MPNHLRIPATDRTPEVDFDFDNCHLKLKGESYPEDVAKFYGPVFEALGNHLRGLRDGACTFEFELIYFNSSSAKAIMSILDRLEEAAGAGVSVTIKWYYDEEDDTIRELGEEFGEDLEHADFHVAKLATEP